MPLFLVAVGEVAAIALGTVGGHLEVLAQLRLVGIGQVLQLLLGSHALIIQCGLLVRLRSITNSKSWC